jgi:hypothetical protein
MRTIARIALATAGFAAVHSVLATRSAKSMAGRLVGEHHRDGAYRVFYVGQSLLSFAALLFYAARLPQRTLYRVSGPPALLMRMGQLTGALHLFFGLRQIDFQRWAGIDNLRALRDGRPIPLGPVAQGPEIMENGRLSTGGVFRWSRHPLNFSGIPIFWLTPHMTTRRLGFNVVSTAYLLLGSMHEEARLRHAYGSIYRAYCESPAPFFWPSARVIKTASVEI